MDVGTMLSTNLNKKNKASGKAFNHHDDAQTHVSGGNNNRDGNNSSYGNGTGTNGNEKPGVFYGEDPE